MASVDKLPRGIIHLFTFIRPFYFNTKFVFGWHEYFHFFGTAVLVYFLGLYWGYGLAVAWDVVDGFKPLYTSGRDKSRLVQNLFYADGFSWSDVLVFDLAGAFVGGLLAYII